MKSSKSKTSTKSGGWRTIRQVLSSEEKSVLLALIKDLHALAPGNRDFLEARCLAGTDDGAILEKYRGKIVEQFFPSRGLGKLKLGEARKAIREYRKASGSVAGTVELMMTYVENGVQFTVEYGDIGESFYDSVVSVLHELSDLLFDEARELYPHFAERLESIVGHSSGIGFGFHDFIAGVVGSLEAALGEE